MKVTFLEPTGQGCQATKRFYFDENNNITSEYITGAYFTSHTETVADIEDFDRKLQSHAARGHCILKGNTNRELRSESRRGSTNTEDSSEWILLDLDGIQGVTDVEDFLTRIGLGDVSYVVQYSSSMGVQPEKGLSAHIFMMLDKAVPAPVLKEWLKELNFKNSFLESQLSLTATGMALSWPLDISTCQNDKLIFIAPPVCDDGIKDTFKGPRIQYVNKTHDTIHHRFVNGLPTRVESNSNYAADKITELRKSAGLKKRSIKSKTTSAGIEYVASPGGATVTGVRRDGEFVRLNLNGGDSWAYYHPADDASILYNFKGEPNYLIKELAPDYYVTAQKAAKQERQDNVEKHQEAYVERAKSNNTFVYLGVRDPSTDQYFTVTADPINDTVEAFPVRSKERLNDFLLDKNMPEIDYAPDWTVSYDLDSDQQFDYANRRINLFQASDYLRKDTNRPSGFVSAPTQSQFPTIMNLITHVLGNDQQSIDMFLNWLAYIIQHRNSPKTAWLLHGTFGTGKGVLFTNILKPIFTQAAIKKPFRDFDDKFNAEIEQSLLVFIDEVHITSDNDRTYQYLKNIISEDEVSIRKMRTDFSNRHNRAAYILASNEVQPLRIEPGERRLHVPPRQEVPLINAMNVNLSFFADIETELPAFAKFLHAYKVNNSHARIPTLSPAKQQLQQISTTTQLHYAQAIANGDLSYFCDFIPASLVEKTRTTLLFADKLESDYVELLINIVEQLPTDKNTHKMILPRDDLITLYQFSSGANHKQAPAKFTRMLANMNLDIKPLKLNGRSVRGLTVEWEYDELKLAAYKRQLYALKPDHQPPKEEQSHGSTSSSS